MDNFPFFFFAAFTLATESAVFAESAVVVKLSFEVLSELPVPLQAIMPKIIDMITLPCMSLLVVFCFILAFTLNNMYCISQKPGLATIQPSEVRYYLLDYNRMEEVLTSVPINGHSIGCNTLFLSGIKIF